MKQFIVFCLFFLLCFSIAEAQTFADIPGPENVLVVYKMPTGLNDTLGFVSDSVKTYYQNARNIPASNIIGIPLPNSVQYQSGLATLRNGGEIIYSNNNRAA
ncbi:MAG: hypothetical protein K8H86_00350 [Ignavibacteriaceae bacterium]|nr:hypothetical protein [Ignavibacteriaceae bacterium]